MSLVSQIRTRLQRGQLEWVAEGRICLGPALQGSSYLGRELHMETGSEQEVGPGQGPTHGLPGQPVYQDGALSPV